MSQRSDGHDLWPRNNDREAGTHLRLQVRDQALRNALKKRSAGVPSYTVPEAAALMSVSPEHLYRLIRADAFPAVRMRAAGEQGRYVVPAKAVEQILDSAVATGCQLDSVDLAQAWRRQVGMPDMRGGDAA